MQTWKKVLMGTTAIGAMALGGAGIAGATGGGDGDGEKADDGPPPAAAVSRAASAAAIKAVGGGTILSVENSDEGGPAAYEVKVRKGDVVTEVQVGKDYGVTGRQADDDQPGAAGQAEPAGGDGDGEHAD